MKNFNSKRFQSIDKHVTENEQNLLNMETFISEKQMEITELQNFILRQFEEIEKWKCKKEQIINVNLQAKSIFIEIKQLFNYVIEHFLKIKDALIKDAVTMSIEKIC